MKNLCPDRVPELIDAADGTTSSSSSLQTHLETCEGCRAELSALQADSRYLAPEPAPEPGPWFAPRVRHEVVARRRRRRVFAWFAPPAIALGALGVVLLTALPSGRLSQGTEPTLDSEWVGALLDEGYDEEEIDSLLARAQGLPDDTALDALVLYDLDAEDTELDAALFDETWGFDVATALYGASDADLDDILEALPG